MAFNEHDLDAIMSHFAEDCVFETPRGPDRWGCRFVGTEEVRRGDSRVPAPTPRLASNAASRRLPLVFS